MLVKALVDIRYDKKDEMGYWKICPVNPGMRSSPDAVYYDAGQVYEGIELDDGRWRIKVSYAKEIAVVEVAQQHHFRILDR